MHTRGLRSWHFECCSFGLRLQGLSALLLAYQRTARHTHTQVSGQKFYYLRNAGALLELALVNYAFNKVCVCVRVCFYEREPCRVRVCVHVY